MSKKYGFGGVPRLVDIISAIPDEYKKSLLPKLKARPIRTASGVSDTIFVVHIDTDTSTDSGSSCDVQTTSVSTYRYDWQYLRVGDDVIH